MHRRPPGPLSVALRAALDRAAHLLRGTSRLHVLAVAVLAVAGLAVVVPGQVSPDRGGALALDASIVAAGTSKEASQNAGPHKAAPQNASPQQAAPANAAPQQAAPPNAAPQDAGAQNAGGGQDRRGDHRREQPQPPDPANPNCTLTVPAQPLSEIGLATPYQLVATDRRADACHETNSDQSAFVEAAIIDPQTGDVSIYHPVVVDRGTAPAAAPVPVRLPPGAVVGVWFGFNGDTLTLDGPGARSCVNGLQGSPFGQFAYCNAPAFFSAANTAISTGKLKLPPLGTGRDGMPCPTTRDFSVVDQDQSDNLATTYRIVDGKVAQNTAATRAGEALTNGSDEGLLARAIDPALGCTPFQAPDLTDGGVPTPALALNELSAAAFQGAPMALTPTSDPMTMVDGAVSTEKTNLYRAGVDQPALPAGQDPAAYCANMLTIAHARLARDAALLRRAAAPAPGSGNLLDFLNARLQESASNLQCERTGR
jgi:hypothetical protein